MQAVVIYLERKRSHREDYVLSKPRSDDDTYVTDAKQTELHHAWRTKGNEVKLRFSFLFNTA